MSITHVETVGAPNHTEGAGTALTFVLSSMTAGDLILVAIATYEGTASGPPTKARSRSSNWRIRPRSSA